MQEAKAQETDYIHRMLIIVYTCKRVIILLYLFTSLIKFDDENTHKMKEQTAFFSCTDGKILNVYIKNSFMYLLYEFILRKNLIFQINEFHFSFKTNFM